MPAASSEVAPVERVNARRILKISALVLLAAGSAVAIYFSRIAIVLTLISAVIATALHHVVDFLGRHHIRRPWGIALTLVGGIGAIMGIVLLVVPPTVSQVKTFMQDAPKMIERAKQTEIYRYIGVRHQSEQEKSETLRQSAAPALKAASGVVSIVAEVASVVFLTVFMLIFGKDLVQRLLQESLPERRLRYEKISRRVYQSVGGYVVGLILICTLNATLTTTALAIAGVSFFLPLGIASGFSSLIPYAGPAVMGLSVTLLTLATKGPWTALAIFVYFLCYGQLEGQVLAPLVFKRTVHVNPLVTLLSILFLAELMGVVGAIIAVPAAASGQIILREFLTLRRERLGTA